jgi:hypothetical protein
MGKASRLKSFALIAMTAASLLSTRAAEATDTLFVWAGDVAHKAPDFFAVVDFDKNFNLWQGG